MSSSEVVQDLPGVYSLEFLSLLFLALISPYIFICGIYCYHFLGRKTGKKLRKIDDRPLAAHINDWHSALFKIEGITAVVIYMFLGLALSLAFPDALGALVPKSVKTLTCTFHPFLLFLHFFVFDSLMWVIHYTQHHWRWLYYKTHSVHHTITSPTMIVALTGYVICTSLRPLSVVIGHLDCICITASSLRQ
jgi:sterol desaturase/sphingolipid hydroxylase (fatty acid hydroxylase superfamily)